ncbi:hypothetical protein FF36_01874 [Frankia torreyi]|uniref:Uncharacterized protein n=1 Tax=Frankia torreyi TaxID=1856 RepID=A0A0D8BI64_9ACTN|nr:MULTISPECIES: hypothetical protein [Frankia]KJE23689.1 hypothetical protein FF36_01874 [Frankia torreyi]KQM05699.1 hypothetical protein FF86_1014117 [Frankia sp. CpI1-P]
MKIPVIGRRDDTADTPDHPATDPIEELRAQLRRVCGGRLRTLDAEREHLDARRRGEAARMRRVGE